MDGIIAMSEREQYILTNATASIVEGRMSADDAVAMWANLYDLKQGAPTLAREALTKYDTAKAAATVVSTSAVEST